MHKSPVYVSGMSDGSTFAYGYRRSSDDLAAFGAGKRVYIDHDTRRIERRRLLDDVRPSDTVCVLYIRDLGGAPVADRQWLERLSEKGVTVIETRPEKPPRPMGRPKAIPADDATRARLSAVWLDGTRSLADRMQSVADILGGPVSRQSLYRALGKPGQPK